MSLDPHNVHQLWGLSPYIDHVDLYKRCGGRIVAEERPGEAGPSVLVLELGPGDCRHAVATLSRLARHADVLPPGSQLHIMVHEDAPEALARYAVLLAALLDTSLPPRSRLETFLELHHNALVRDNVAGYVDANAREIEAIVTDAAAGFDPHAGGLRSLLDFSLMRHQDRDAVVDALCNCRLRQQYDMALAWDTRVRKLTGDRFDHRANMADWDYHMRLVPMGVPGEEAKKGTVVSFRQYRSWRLTGVAYELRDAKYTAPNRTLISTATGRTMEFKGRDGSDKGRSVTAKGYWGDIVNSPYLCFGVTCDDRRFFEQSNGVYMSTAVDVAEYNVRAALHELREGGTYASRDVEMAPKVQGVTTVEDLAGAAEKRGGGGGGSGSGGGGEGESGTERDEGTSGVGTGASGEGRGEVEGVEDALAACGVDGVGRVGGDSGGADGDHAGGEGKAGAEEAARETALDAAMWARLSRVRVSFLTGDLGRALARPDVAGRASVVTVGRNDLHALKGKGIARVLGDSGVVAVESAKYMLEVTREQADAYAANLVQLADGEGLEAIPGDVATQDGQVLLRRKGGA